MSDLPPNPLILKRQKKYEGLKIIDSTSSELLLLNQKILEFDFKILEIQNSIRENGLKNLLFLMFKNPEIYKKIEIISNFMNILDKLNNRSYFTNIDIIHNIKIFLTKKIEIDNILDKFNKNKTNMENKIPFLI